MDIKAENRQLHCRTCLANVSADQRGSVYLIDCSNSLRNWIDSYLLSSSTSAEPPYDENMEQRFPQQLCHECYETLRVTNEFRTKVQQAEQLFTDELPLPLGNNTEHGPFASCRICLRQYPQAVQSLTCHVRDAPHLREWLEWSGAHNMLDNEWGACSDSNVVCRFCYSKLRDCYEWHLAAKETSEYLKGRMLPEFVWSNNNQSKDVEPPLSPSVAVTQYAEQYSQLSSVAVTIKEEMFPTFDEYPECDYMSPSNPSGITEPANDLDSSLLCLDVPYNVKRDFHCKSCAISFSNSILYENHICPVSTHSVQVTQSSDKDAFDKEEYGPSATASLSSSRNGAKKVCQQCQKRFNKSFLLEAHILQVHQGKKKPFLCKYCSHAYLTHTHLKRHIKNSHKQEWMQAFQDVTSNMNFWI